MSGGPTPWWASEVGVEGLDDLDPIEAFRAARRPGGTTAPGDVPAPEDHPAQGPVPGADEGSGDGREDTATGGADIPQGHRPELCGICPLCTLARNLEETRPELLEHLTEAARHLSAAVRALLEPPPPGGGAEASPPRRTGADGAARRPGPGVERIPLDADPGPRPNGTHGDGTPDTATDTATDTTGERGDG